MYKINVHVYHQPVNFNAEAENCREKVKLLFCLNCLCCLSDSGSWQIKLLEVRSAGLDLYLSSYFWYASRLAKLLSNVSHGEILVRLSTRQTEDWYFLSSLVNLQLFCLRIFLRVSQVRNWLWLDCFSLSLAMFLSSAFKNSLFCRYDPLRLVSQSLNLQHKSNLKLNLMQP